MANIVISIDPEGTATYLCNQHTDGLFPEAARPRRASHVEPWSLSLKFLFRALRGAFGDDSWAADWTRRWPCRWTVDLSPVGGPSYGLFYSRDAAIEFEIEWLNEKFLGRW